MIWEQKLWGFSLQFLGRFPSADPALYNSRQKMLWMIVAERRSHQSPEPYPFFIQKSSTLQWTQSRIDRGCKSVHTFGYVNNQSNQVDWEIWKWIRWYDIHSESKMFRIKYDSIFIVVKMFKFLSLPPDATIISRFEVVTKRVDWMKHLAFCSICLFFVVYNFLMPIKLAKTGSIIMDSGINICYGSAFFNAFLTKNMLVYQRYKICKLAISLHRCDRMVHMIIWMLNSSLIHLIYFSWRQFSRIRRSKVKSISWLSF